MRSEGSPGQDRAGRIVIFYSENQKGIDGFKHFVLCQLHKECIAGGK